MQERTIETIQPTIGPDRNAVESPEPGLGACIVWGTLEFTDGEEEPLPGEETVDGVSGTDGGLPGASVGGLSPWD